jgi:hypothetical protein
MSFKFKIRSPPLNSARKLTKEEFASQFPGLELASKPELDDDRLISDDAFFIQHWSNFELTTTDGRSFALFIDAESILHRLKAVGIEVKRPPNFAGMILEIDSDEPPFMFRTLPDLADAWSDLHELCSVPMTPDECDRLDLPLPEQEGEE